MTAPKVPLAKTANVHFTSTLAIEISRYPTLVAGTKNILLRLDPAVADQLQAVADVEGRSVSDVAREAIGTLVNSRRKDRRFQRLLTDNLARQERLLSMISGEES
jgi:hypothetical protein